MEARTRTSFRLPTSLVKGLKDTARKQNRSLNSLVERYLMDSFYHEPNETTLAAMRECESGVELDELTAEDIENFEEYVKRL